jgi:glycosyltransferase involved in cell wall biosynthesis
VWFNVRLGMFGESPWLSVSGLLAPMLVRQMGYPTVVTLHEMIELADLATLNAPGGILAPLGARFITSLATQADVICLTMNQHLKWLAKPRPQADCVHIPHGAVSEPVMLKEPAGKELLLFNMLAPFKGVELLLDVFPQLRAAHPDLQLSIAGEEHPRFPGYAKYLREQFADVRGISWLGKIPDDEVIELFRRSNIVVLPYSASTGSSSVLYSAATWGRAVVASDLSEMRELAREQNFQIEFFENRNPDSLRNAIQTLLASPERRQHQIQHNFRSIQNASMEITCHRYLRAFNRALEKRQSLKRISIPHLEAETA